MEAKRAALKNLIKHMQKMMVQGHGDEELDELDQDPEHELAEVESGEGEEADVGVKPDGTLPYALDKKEPLLARKGESMDDDADLKSAVKQALQRRKHSDGRKTMVIVKAEKTMSPSKQMQTIAKAVRKRSKM